MLKFVLLVLLAVLCRNGLAQEEFPFKEAIFQGPSGYRPGQNFEYFMVKHGLFKSVGDDEEATMIAEWIRQHPNAKLVPVSILGEKSRHPIVYFWAADGEDNLNLFLVKKGIYFGFAMLDTVQVDQLVKNPKWVARLEAMQRAGNPKRVPSPRLVSDARYEDFVKQLVAAETAAQSESNGVWSDKFKPLRDKMGLVPLNALPLSVLLHPVEQETGGQGTPKEMKVQ
ncbi:MAG TPA: hypothetical protein VF861_17605 [Telluria sp.]